MWSPEARTRQMIRLAARFAAVAAVAGLAGGCFQPLYGERSPTGGPGVGPALSAVQVVPINTPNGTPIARVGVELRDKLLFQLTGGGPAASPTHRLVIVISASALSIVVDPTTARPDLENYALEASFTLTEIATGKPVVTAQTFARVAYDIPGQQQRFAKTRGQRDAENRAAMVVAENIRTRLAAYFAAGA